MEKFSVIEYVVNINVSSESTILPSFFQGRTNGKAMRINGLYYLKHGFFKIKFRHLKNEDTIYAYRKESNPQRKLKIILIKKFDEDTSRNSLQTYLP